jgi:hypothetical protein
MDTWCLCSEEIINFFREVDLGEIKKLCFFLYPSRSIYPARFGMSEHFPNIRYRIATPRILYGLFLVYQKVNNVNTSASTEMRNLLRQTLEKTINRGRALSLISNSETVLDPNHMQHADYLKLVMQSASTPHEGRLRNIHVDEPLYDIIEEHIRRLTGYGYVAPNEIEHIDDDHVLNIENSNV